MVGSLARNAMKPKNCANANLPTNTRQTYRVSLSHITSQAGDRSTSIHRVHGTPQHMLRFIHALHPAGDPPRQRPERSP